MEVKIQESMKLIIDLLPLLKFSYKKYFIWKGMYYQHKSMWNTKFLWIYLHMMYI